MTSFGIGKVSKTTIVLSKYHITWGHIFRVFLKKYRDLCTQGYQEVRGGRVRLRERTVEGDPDQGDGLSGGERDGVPLRMDGGPRRLQPVRQV